MTVEHIILVFLACLFAALVWVAISGYRHERDSHRRQEKEDSARHGGVNDERGDENRRQNMTVELSGTEIVGTSADLAAQANMKGQPLVPRQIQSVCGQEPMRSDELPDYYEVGKGGVTKIIIEPDQGIHWIRVFVDSELAVSMNLAFVATIHYMPVGPAQDVSNVE